MTGDDCDKDFGTPDDAGTKNLSQITQGLVDHAGTTTFECAGDVEHVARELLMSYRDQGNCVLAYADYLDLRGRVWGCLVQGGAWVDVCLVEEQEEGERCCVRVLRIEAQEMAQLLAEDGDEPYGNERE